MGLLWLSPFNFGASRKPKIFYGWYIVAVGFLSHVACAFHMSSTLSVFLKPLTEDLAVSRGLFSLLRSGEILIGAAMAPLVGPLVDRYGGRWLMAGGALAAGAGFVLLSQVGSFGSSLVALDAHHPPAACYVPYGRERDIARWFVRKRGRAIAIASLGQGLSKVLIPVVTATLFVWVGWRWTWSIFGVVTLILIVIPAVIFMRRSPEEMGLKPDGGEVPLTGSPPPTNERDEKTPRQMTADETVWTWREVIRTRTFWLICFIYGMANVGIAGLNLHVFAFVTDIGFPTIVAATALSIIAMAQLGSTLIWGVIGDARNPRFEHGRF